MLSWWRKRSPAGRTATELYGSIVTAARREAFYVRDGVPDTPDGRFALLIVHMFLAMERLRSEGDAGQTLSRALVEAFVSDMDDSMREMGVGDLSVPKKVKKAAGALYDCVAAYRAAIEVGDLAEALRATVMPGDAAPAADAVASYMKQAAAALAAQPAPEILAGRVAFPDP